MRKTKRLILAASVLLLLSSALMAKEKRGAEIIVVKNDGSRLTGELIAVRKDSLLLLADEPRSATVHSPAWETIKEVIIVRRSKRGQAPGSGAPLSGTNGFVMPYAGGDESPNFMKNSSSDTVAQGAVAYGLIELVADGIGRASAGPDISILIDSRSEAKLRSVQAQLAKMARVKGIQ